MRNKKMRVDKENQGSPERHRIIDGLKVKTQGLGVVNSNVARRLAGSPAASTKGGSGGGSPTLSLPKYALAKMKADNLFLDWAAHPDTVDMILGYLGRFSVFTCALPCRRVLRQHHQTTDTHVHEMNIVHRTNYHSPLCLTISFSPMYVCTYAA